MKTFLKGIFVGIGGVSPGLSGSVLLVIFGLYAKVIDAVSHIFKNFKKNIIFLMPLALGMGVGVIIFGKLVDLLLDNFPMQTRFAFLGLILGAVPLFFKEVKKNGFSKRHYAYVAVSAVLGLVLLFFSKDLFPKVTDPSIFESVLLGVAVAASSIVPGIDSAVILSTFGLYELYIDSIANFNLQILIPAVIGAGIGALAIAFIINKLISKFYTSTFSVIFGFFISIIPSVLDESCYVAFDFPFILSVLLMIVGFSVSFYLGDIKKHNEIIKDLFSKKRTK